MSKVASAHGTDTLKPEEQRALKKRIVRDGLRRVAEEIGLGREAVVRLTSGIPTRRGTVTQARAALARPSDSAPPHGAR